MIFIFVVFVGWLKFIFFESLERLKMSEYDFFGLLCELIILIFFVVIGFVGGVVN